MLEGPSEVPTIDFAPNSVPVLDLRLPTWKDSMAFHGGHLKTHGTGCFAEEWRKVGGSRLPNFATRSSKLAGKELSEWRDTDARNDAQEKADRKIENI